MSRGRKTGATSLSKIIKRNEPRSEQSDPSGVHFKQAFWPLQVRMDFNFKIVVVVRFLRMNMVSKGEDWPR